jgi:hypothetical protein
MILRAFPLAVPASTAQLATPDRARTIRIPRAVDTRGEQVALRQHQTT